MRFSPGCLCCGSVDDCDFCAVTVEAWEFTFAGVAGTRGCDSGFTSCSDYNGTWTVHHRDDGFFDNCGWVTNETLVCTTPASKAYFLQWNSGAGEWELFASAQSGGTFAARYVLADEDWDCLGPNVMDFDASWVGGSCSSWPATITVSPA